MEPHGDLPVTSGDLWSHSAIFKLPIATIYAATACLAYSI